MRSIRKNTRSRVKIPWFFLLLLGSMASLIAQSPNIIVFLVDDLGWSDLSVQGSVFYESPNIDALANSGMRFTHGYAAHPVCSPSRAAILTGKNPGRLHLTNWIGGAADGVPYERELALDENTIAEVLEQNGYTTGFFGKWHLGETAEFWPEANGFQSNFGGHNVGQPPGGYFAPYNNPRLSDGPDGEYLTDRLADEAVQWMRTNQDSPFFLYFSLYTVHTPIQSKAQTTAYYQDKKTENDPCDTVEWMDEIRGSRLKNCDDVPAFASMVHHLDSAVGLVLDEVNALGLDSNTIVVFTSDNGGVSYWNNTSSNLPLRGAKGWLYEGGIRVPFFIKWPGVTNAGSTSDVPVVGMDLYPTLLDAAGLPLNAAQHIDGKSLLTILNAQDGSGIRTEEIIFHYPHFHHGNPGTLPGSAIIFGEYKLVEWWEGTSEGDDQDYPYTFELYKITEDEGELVDIKDVEPDIANLLRYKLHHYRDTANVNMPADFGMTTPPTEPLIEGCTNINAGNFNLYATVDDGSCTSVINKKNFTQGFTVDQNGSELTVQFKYKENYTLNLLTLTGTTLFESTGNGQLKIPHTDFKPGVYLLQVKTSSHQQYQKIILH